MIAALTVTCHAAPEHRVALLSRMQEVRAIQPWIVQGREGVDEPDALFRRDTRQPGVDGRDDAASVGRVALVRDNGSEERDREVRLGEPDHLPQVRHDDIGGHLEGGVVGAFHDEDESGVVRHKDRRQPGQPPRVVSPPLPRFRTTKPGWVGARSDWSTSGYGWAAWPPDPSVPNVMLSPTATARLGLFAPKSRRQPEPGRGGLDRHDQTGGDTDGGEPPHRHSFPFERPASFASQPQGLYRRPATVVQRLSVAGPSPGGRLAADVSGARDSRIGLAQSVGYSGRAPMGRRHADCPHRWAWRGATRDSLTSSSCWSPGALARSRPSGRTPASA